MPLRGKLLKIAFQWVMPPLPMVVPSPCTIHLTTPLTLACSKAWLLFWRNEAILVQGIFMLSARTSSARKILMASMAFAAVGESYSMSLIL